MVAGASRTRLESKHAERLDLSLCPVVTYGVDILLLQATTLAKAGVGELETRTCFRASFAEKSGPTLYDI